MSKRDFPPTHPGEMLLEEFLKPMKIGQYQLANRGKAVEVRLHGRRWRIFIRMWVVAGDSPWTEGISESESCRGHTKSSMDDL